MLFERQVLRKKCEPKMEEGMERWRREYSGDCMICIPYYGPNIARVIKSKRMRWAGHIARMETGEVRAGVWAGDLRERGHLEELVLDGSITLRCIIKK